MTDLGIWELELQPESRVESFAALALSYFRRRIGNLPDAEDCASECVAVLWRKRDSAPQGAEDYRAWAYGVARNVLASFRRRNARRLRSEESLLFDIQSDEVDSDLRLSLRAALLTLSQRDREMVLLVAWEGLAVYEAGAVFDLSPDASRACYSRARRRLMKRLS